jgi:hypothetical protein
MFCLDAKDTWAARRKIIDCLSKRFFTDLEPGVRGAIYQSASATKKRSINGSAGANAVVARTRGRRWRPSRRAGHKFSTFADRSLHEYPSEKAFASHLAACGYTVLLKRPGDCVTSSKRLSIFSELAERRGG